MITQRMLDLLDIKSLKMADLCRYLHINTSTMTNWKNRGTDPPAKYIIPICEFLNVSCEYFLTGKEEPASTNLSIDDAEWLTLIHKLPESKRNEFKARIAGYLECYDESVAADKNLGKTGTTNSVK